MCHFDCLFRAGAGPALILKNLKTKAKRDFAEKLSLCLEALPIDEDLVDLDLDEVLAVSLHLLVLLLALELEDEDLVAAAFADGGGGDLGSGEAVLGLALFGPHGQDVGEVEC